MTGRKRKKAKTSSSRIAFILIVTEIILVLAGIILYTIMKRQQHMDALHNDDVMQIDFLEETEKIRSAYVPEPVIDEQLLTVNKWSRPGSKLKGVEYIVIHYLGNPGTSAQQNHDYFESLKTLHNAYMSANYVIGIDGEIIHCVPDDEVAYASNKANRYSLSIENCHKTESGKLTKKTYESLVHLTAWLSEKYGLDRAHIIRHYDVTGKPCPKYYVEHPDKWEKFLDDVMAYRKQWEDKIRESEMEEKARSREQVDELTAFMESNFSADIREERDSG